ncbi:MAG: hypothetical protein CL608_26155 [Anaerolineaceae bacterium]|nr:hypothetical protein [Anaerolineaceae bacterium]
MSLLLELCTAVATEVATGELGLVIGPRAERLQMLELSAVLALRGTVRVLDGGNSYNALYLARYIRRHTVHLTETLNRISVARAFTCYQMVTLLQETPISPTPTLVLDLLATFSDESIDLRESVRLLRLAIAHLQRLCRLAPVVVSIRPFPSHQSDRTILTELVMNAASHYFFREAQETAVSQPTLFSF